MRPKQGKNTASAASTLIVLQISARIFTFAFNQILIRIVSPTIFGLANIQLELLLSTILFLSREAIRTILLRTIGSQSEAGDSSCPRKGVRNAVHNISLLPIPIGMVLTTSACSAYIAYLSPQEMRSVSTFHISVFLYATGALTELLYEPLNIRALALGHPALRVKAEGAAVLAKCIITISVITLLEKFPVTWAAQVAKDERSLALLGFGLGQLGYGTVMLCVHLAFFMSRYTTSHTFNLFVPYPDTSTALQHSSSPSRWLDIPTLSLCAEMSKQSLVKHGLTEADKFAIAKFASLEDQGGYALASNYGSLIARIVFQPVEETARIVFSQDLVTSDTPIESKEDSVTATASLDRISGLLSALFRLHFLLGFLLLTFGAPMSVPFLHILAGPRWAYQTKAPVILGAYTAYLPVMGINGLVEGFFQSTASKSQLAQYNYVLLAASITFAAVLAGPNISAELVGGSAWTATTAMVWANAGSLMIRAAYCWNYLKSYFHKATRNSAQGKQIMQRIQPVAALPSRPVGAAFIIVAACLRSIIPKLMPSSREVFHAAMVDKGRLASIMLLAPVLCVGFLGVVITLSTVILFDRLRIAEALGFIRGSGH